MKWLVTCFEPFAGAQTNSSQIACEELRKSEWSGRVQFYGPLKVTFKDSWTELERILKRDNVDGVLALGQSEGRTKISLECVGLNWIDARIPDNAGDKPSLKPILEGPNALFSNIPWARLGENEDWQRSYSAGTYVCNFLMFQILVWAKQNQKLGGFVHIPAEMQSARAVQALSKILGHLCQLQPEQT